MEFERSIFRMHERLLMTRPCKSFVRVAGRITCALFAYFLISFIVYHKVYVNSSDVLVTAIEDQLLSQNKSPEYRVLTYSETTDRFIFCNKVTFLKNDTVHLAE